jgi:hypothetical protein
MTKIVLFWILMQIQQMTGNNETPDKQLETVNKVIVVRPCVWNPHTRSERDYYAWLSRD